MSNHTPGPWSYWSGYNPFDKLEAQVTAEGGDIVIASYNSLIEQGEANACLIAAAPDLLAAAQKTVDAWAAFIDSFNYTPGIGDMAEDMEFRELLVLRAAIAKARGES